MVKCSPAYHYHYVQFATKIVNFVNFQNVWMLEAIHITADWIALMCNIEIFERLVELKVTIQIDTHDS